MQHKPRKSATPTSADNRRIRNICVYCGSNPGANPAYAQAARQLGPEHGQGAASASSTAAAASA